MHVYEYRATVRRVVDGDTVDVDIDLGFDVTLKSQRVRLLGVDTPESRTRDKIEKIYGLAAKARLSSLLCEGPVTIHTTKDKRGKFGRILATFFTNGLSVNQTLIDEGHAVMYFGQSKKLIQAAHLDNRERLRLHNGD